MTKISDDAVAATDTYGKKNVYVSGSGAIRSGGEHDKWAYWLVPLEGLREIARRYWVGVNVKKYSPTNWRRGIEFSKMIDHAYEHLGKLAHGVIDEDDPRSPPDQLSDPFVEMLPHLGAIGWFVCCMCWFIATHRRDLDDRICIAEIQAGSMNRGKGL